uniref:Phospholipid--sterol O-acyltransferase n=1 Tax=Tanacetum cinerariifolium TaxID=118510 RepID=A0A6L2KF76_TANCI|nr:phospholipid--sterol O-acyltransferase [Tanacetum cinerariifolium]
MEAQDHQDPLEGQGRSTVDILDLILIESSVLVVNGGDNSKLSGIIIPGFASTQLRAWSILDCPYSPLDFNPLDLVWLDTTKNGLLVVHVRQ